MSRLLLLALLMFPVIAQAELTIDHAWIKNLPPTVPVRAGYMTIVNPAKQAVSIVSFSSDAFSSIDMHETVMKDGMMHMQHVPELTIEAGAKVTLAPGGMHMMMEPVKPTITGEQINITIKLSDGSQQTVIFTVEQ
ncbi:MAG: copper chaperone PCu(A)C [Gammaproteobacteria bacterium]|nr:copper chaperone PCu(A)C [Gammaproteobacteria bacterium]